METTREKKIKICILHALSISFTGIYSEKLLCCGTFAQGDKVFSVLCSEIKKNYKNFHQKATNCVHYNRILCSNENKFTESTCVRKKKDEQSKLQKDSQYITWKLKAGNNTREIKQLIK